MENNKVVEVLQRDLNHHNELIQLRIFSCNVSKDREVVNALGKALLWKEKLDRLEKWLDEARQEEINIVNEIGKNYSSVEIKIATNNLLLLKQVREILNEGVLK